MKKLAGLFLLLLILSVSAHAKELRINSEEDWKPYVINTNGSISGFSIEVVANVLKTMGVTFHVTPYPWKRALKMVMDGEVDALFNASKKPDREEKCYYPDEALFDSNYVFFIAKANEGKLKYDTFDDLKPYRIGIAAGYAYSDDFMAFVKAAQNFDEAKDDELNFKKLAKDRVQYFPAELGNGMQLIKDLGLKNEISYLPKPLTQKPYYIIFNKQNVEKSFVDSFSQALKAFKATPEFRTIYDQYFK